MAQSGKAFPAWPPIRGSMALSSMNLDTYIDMTYKEGENEGQGVFGKVYSLQEFCAWADYEIPYTI